MLLVRSDGDLLRRVWSCEGAYARACPIWDPPTQRSGPKGGGLMGGFLLWHDNEWSLGAAAVALNGGTHGILRARSMVLAWGDGVAGSGEHWE